MLELQSGTVNGIDNPGPDDFAVIEGDDKLTLQPRAGTEHLLRRHEQHSSALRQREGAPGVRHGHRPQRIVDNFYPTGSIVATQFMPARIFGCCEGDDWYKYDPEMAKKILAEDGFSTRRLQDQDLLP